MMKFNERYRWEAESADGKLIIAGGDMAGAVRFSLIPASGTGLPRHDLAGVKMIRRFGRGFNKVKFNNTKLEGRFFWENSSKILKTEISQVGKIEVGDFIGKGVAGETWHKVDEVFEDHITLSFPYLGKSKAKGMQAKRKIQFNPMEYVQCVVCENFRLWVRYSDGTVLISPVDFELYL